MDEQDHKECDIIQTVVGSGIGAASCIFNLPKSEVSNLVFREINRHQDEVKRHQNTIINLHKRLQEEEDATTIGSGRSSQPSPQSYTHKQVVKDEFQVIQGVLGRGIDAASNVYNLPKSEVNTIVLKIIQNSRNRIAYHQKSIATLNLSLEEETAMIRRGMRSQPRPPSYTQDQAVQMTRQHREELNRARLEAEQARQIAESTQKALNDFLVFFNSQQAQVGSSWYTPPPMYWPPPPMYSPHPPAYHPPPPAYGPTPPTYRPTPPTYRPTPPTYHPTPPTYGPTPPTNHPLPPLYGPTRLTYGPTPPMYGPNPPTYRPTPSTYGPSPPTYSPNPASYGPPPPTFGPSPLRVTSPNLSQVKENIHVKGASWMTKEKRINDLNNTMSNVNSFEALNSLDEDENSSRGINGESDSMDGKNSIISSSGGDEDLDEDDVYEYDGYQIQFGDQFDFCLNGCHRK